MIRLFPLKKMLEQKDEQFALLFKKVMNLHLGITIGGKPLSDKDRTGRARQAIAESLPKD